MNSDGTRAGFSGNGTRIFAQYLVDAGDARPGQLIALEIQDDNAAPPSCNLVRVRLFENNDGRIEITAPHVPRFGAGAVAAKVGAVQLIAKDDGVPPIRYFIPTISKIGTTMTGSPSAWANSVLVDIGNPHCVTFVAQADQMPDFGFLNSNDAALRAIAFRHIGAEQIFTNGINLQWARLESRKRLRLMIYERGEGPTPASGSSASAAACAAFACGLLENDVEVVMPGGSLDIHIDGSPAEIKAVRMSGFATRILDGEFNLRSLQA